MKKIIYHSLFIVLSTLIIACNGGGSSSGSSSYGGNTAPIVNNKMYDLNLASGDIVFNIPQYEGKYFTYLSETQGLQKLCAAIGAQAKYQKYSANKFSLTEQYNIHSLSDEIVFSNDTNTSNEYFSYIEKLACVFPVSSNYGYIDSILNDASYGNHPYERLINFRYSLSSLSKDILPKSADGFLLLNIEEKGPSFIANRLDKICSQYISTVPELKDKTKVYFVRHFEVKTKDTKILYDIFDHSLKNIFVNYAYDRAYYADKIKCPQQYKNF